jgi:predicted PurR-regulated permease PerM
MVQSSADAFQIDRERLGWWLVAAVLVVLVGLVVRAFVGTLVFGLFVYYAIRPIRDRLQPYTDSRIGATAATMVAAALPLLVVLLYAGGLAVRELLAVAGSDTAQVVLNRFVDNPESVTTVVSDPRAILQQLDRVARLQQGLSAVAGVLGFLGNAFLRLSLALALAFFLLQDGTRVENWFRSEVTSPDSTADVFLRGVDADLETVYFGNVLTVVGVTVVGVVVYNLYNLVAPPVVSLPVPTLLAVLTGLATFVPLVVGKLVYVPASGFLLYNAVRFDGPLVYPVAFLVVAFLVLDILPQTILRPFISGQSLHSGLVLFGYVLGAAYFGWYGLFLGPLIVVLSVQFLKQVLPDLADGSEMRPSSSEGVEIGTDPLAGAPDAEALGGIGDVGRTTDDGETQTGRVGSPADDRAGDEDDADDGGDGE